MHRHHQQHQHPLVPSTLHNKQGGFSDLIGWSHIVSLQLSSLMLFDGDCSCLTSVVHLKSNLLLFLEAIFTSKMCEKIIITHLTDTSNNQIGDRSLKCRTLKLAKPKLETRESSTETWNHAHDSCITAEQSLNGLCAWVHLLFWNLC